jgi:hypothetical protein
MSRPDVDTVHATSSKIKKDKPSGKIIPGFTKLEAFVDHFKVIFNTFLSKIIL